ncbi:ubiquitin-protein ligase peroxin 12 [Massospora cicadina]|nr:ubiquitin-protein ligase peroxin 12 [Massospora cicadina]
MKINFYGAINFPTPGSNGFTLGLRLTVSDQVDRLDTMDLMSHVGSSADGLRPSLFELIAQDKLNSLIRPALRYVITGYDLFLGGVAEEEPAAQLLNLSYRDILRRVYAHRHPRYLLQLLKFYDEFYAVLMLVIERHYLHDWNAAFSESFYGLRRLRKAMPASNRSSFKLDPYRGNSLARSDLRNSLLTLVAVPYVKAKLDDLYEGLTGGAAARLLGADMFEEEEELSFREEGGAPYVSRLKAAASVFGKKLTRAGRALFVNLYPHLHLAYHLVPLGFHIAYLFERTDFHNPTNFIAGLTMRRMSADDYKAHRARKVMERGVAANAAANMRRGGRFAYFGWLVLRYGLDGLKVALPMAVFLLKFLEWWYGSENQRSAGMYLGPLPDPPTPIKPDASGVPLPQDPQRCPLCARIRTNPAMLPTGYTFCYPCLFSYVQLHGRCPVTWQRAGLEEVRKLFAAEEG